MFKSGDEFGTRRIHPRHLIDEYDLSGLARAFDQLFQQAKRDRPVIGHLTSRGYKSRTVALMENGSWAPQAAKVMQTLLEGCKDITLLTPVVRIMSALGNESRAQLEQLAQAIAQG